jgi:putative heme iron utilization protein
VDVLTDLTHASELVEAEPDILEHMNQDHADTCRLYATKLLGAADGAWRCAGCDPEGMELQLDQRALRLFFPQRIISTGSLRQSLKDMAEKARAIV